MLIKTNEKDVTVTRIQGGDFLRWVPSHGTISFSRVDREEGRVVQLRFNSFSESGDDKFFIGKKEWLEVEVLAQIIAQTSGLLAVLDKRDDDVVVYKFI